jgi:uncharacterized protein
MLWRGRENVPQQSQRCGTVSRPCRFSLGRYGFFLPALIVGSLRVRLILRQSRSLKDKRQVVSSIKDRLRQQFNVSAAEVEAQDNRQFAVLGFAMVGNEAFYVRTTFEQIVSALRSHPVAELVDHQMEI